MISLNIFSGPLNWDSSSPFSSPIILKLHLLIVSKIVWMFCDRKILRFNTFFDQCIYFSIVSSKPEVVSSISCILLSILASVIPVCIPTFFISRIPSVFLYFVASMSIFRPRIILLFSSTLCFFLAFFKGFFSFPPIMCLCFP